MATNVTIDLTQVALSLSPNTSYSIVVDENFVVGDDLQPSFAISQGQFAFQTSSNGPSLISTTPTNNSTGSLSFNITYEFDVTLVLGTGNFYLYKKSVGSDVLVSTISSSNSRIYTDETTLFVDVSGLVESFETYYITTDTNLIKDVFGIGTTLTEDSLKWTFGGVEPALIASLGYLRLNADQFPWINSGFWTAQREYLGGTSNLLFGENTPGIIQFNNFIVTIKVISGVLKHPSTGVVASQISLVGNTVQINPLMSLVEYYPNRGFSGTEKVTIGLYAGLDFAQNPGYGVITPGGLLEKVVVDATYGGFGGNTEEIVALTSSQDYTIPFPLNHFYSKFDLLVVGGGGAGSYREILTNNGVGSGGGGGGAVVVQNLNISSYTSSNSIVVGRGGEPGQTPGQTNWIGGDGGNSSAFGYTATGGLGSQIISQPPYTGAYTRGGESGVPNKNSTFTRNLGGWGGYDTNTSTFKGGGGGGSGDPGQDAVSQATGTPTFGYFSKGGDANIDSYFAVFGASGTQGRYGGGGGGGSMNSAEGLGGDGGGGAGGDNLNPPQDGQPNTGGGGGGGSPAGYYTGADSDPPSVSRKGYPGKGADGVVKLRFHS